MLTNTNHHGYPMSFSDNEKIKHGFRELLHNPAFWATIGVFAVLVALIALGIALDGAPVRDMPMPFYYSPYMM